MVVVRDWLIGSLDCVVITVIVNVEVVRSGQANGDDCLIAW